MAAHVLAKSGLLLKSATSGRELIVTLAQPRIAPDRLGRLPNGAQEGSAPTLGINDTRLDGDNIDRMTAFFQHQPGGFDTKVLDSEPDR